jgi:hypothetical protein
MRQTQTCMTEQPSKLIVAFAAATYSQSNHRDKAASSSSRITHPKCSWMRVHSSTQQVNIDNATTMQGKTTACPA